MPSSDSPSRVTDPDRLAAVAASGLEATSEVPGLDRAAALVRTLLGVPAAFVSVVGADRQTVAAQQGFTDALWVPRQGPLTESYCRYAVEADAPLVVDDAGDSPLACAGVLAEAVGIRAYLGVPFRGPSGATLGALCAIDGAARPWTAREIEVVTALAATVESEIALRAEVASRSQAEARYRLLFDESPDATLVIDPDTEIVLDANAAASDLYGVDRDRLVGTSLRAFSPAPERGDAAAARLVAGSQREQFDTVQVRPDGTPVDLRICAATVDLDGRQVLLSVNRDVTALKQAERDLARARAWTDRLAMVAAKTTNGVVVTDAAGRTEWVNEGFTRITGYTLGDLRGRKPGTVLQGPGTDPETVAHLHAQMRSREPFSAEILNYHKNGAPYWVRIEVTPLVEDDGTLTGFMAIETDVTERRESEERLRASEARFRLVTETAGIGMFVSDVAQGSTTFTFPARAVLGHDSSEPFTFAQFNALTHPDDRGVVAEAIAESRDPLGSGRIDFDHRVVRPDTGEVRWVSVRGEAVFDGGPPRAGGDRQPVQIVGVVIDATERKRSEEAAREIEARFRRLAETASDVILTIDESSRIHYANSAAEAVFGYTPEELAGRDLADLMPARFQGAHAEGLARYLRSGQRRFDWGAVEVPGQRRDGTEVPLSISFGEYVQNGHRAFTAIVRDVSAQKEAERALRESEAQYRTVVEAVRDAVIETDAQGRITFVNSAWAQITGVSVADSLGRVARSFVHPDWRAGHDAGFAPMSAREAEYARFESAMHRPGGEVRQVEIHTRLRHDEAGAVVGTVGTVTDITDAARFHAEREARQRADEMLRLKDAFLNNMSHELRTPLTAILGFAEVLEDEVGGEQREFAQAIVRGGRRLQETLNSVLDLAQIQAGAVAMAVEPVDLAAEATEAVAMLRPVADAAGLALVLDVGDAGALALADRAALHRVLHNLVGNAVKFTPAGTVTVSVDAAGPRVRLAVTDTGIGIAAEFLPRLFDEFTQASEGHARTHEGNGLGLSITRTLVDLMDGEIAVESVPGAGSRFTVTLPAAPRPLATAASGA